MKLSINKILKEITARTGPRTGGFEIDKEEVLRTSREIAQKITSLQPDGDNENPRGESQYHFYMDMKNPITGQPSTVTVLPKRPKEGVNSIADWNVKNNAINLYIILDSMKTTAVGTLTKYIYTLLMHELAHKFDPRVHKDIMNRNYIYPEKGWKEYLNQPSEIKSHLQQVIEEIESAIPKFREKMINSNQFKQTKEWIRQNPDFLLQGSATWKRIKDHLTPENEKKFLLAVFRLSRLL